MFIKSLMFVSYDLMNININLSVSYMGEIGVAPLTRTTLYKISKS